MKTLFLLATFSAAAFGQCGPLGHMIINPVSSSFDCSPSAITGAATNGVLYADSTGKINSTATGGAGTLCLTSADGGVPAWGACSGSAATAWSAITAGTNTTALVMGTLGSLTISGSGTINATHLGASAAALYAKLASPTFTGTVVLPSGQILTLPTISSTGFTNANHAHIAANSGGTLAEAALALTDVTTNDASTSNHGFLLKLDNDATHFMNGQGAWTTPAGGTGSPCTLTALSLQYNNAGAFGCLPDFTFSSHTLSIGAAGVVDGTAGTWSLPAVHLRSDTSFTLSAGVKATANLSATTAGLRLTAGTLPSAPAAGDLALDASNLFYGYDGGLSAWRKFVATNGVTSVDRQIPIWSGTSGSLLATAADAGDIDAPNFCADAGSTDAYACNLTPAITAYVTGNHYRIKANTANTGAATVQLNSIASPKTIVKVAGGITTTLANNDIRAGQWIDLVYDGTNMQLQSTLGNSASGMTIPGSGTETMYRSDATTLSALANSSVPNAGQWALSTTPATSATQSVLGLGSAITAGTSAANSGTYVGINSGAAFIGDFFRFEKDGTLVSRLFADAFGSTKFYLSPNVYIASDNSRLLSAIYTGGGDNTVDWPVRTLVSSGTAPSVATCGTIGTGSTMMVGTITSGTTGVCGPVLTFGFTATTGWVCHMENRTTHAAFSNEMFQTASTATTATFTGTTVNADVLQYSCLPY